MKVHYIREIFNWPVSMLFVMRQMKVTICFDSFEIISILLGLNRLIEDIRKATQSILSR